MEADLAGSRRTAACRGVTLIELLVALVIGSIVVGMAFCRHSRSVRISSHSVNPILIKPPAHQPSMRLFSSISI